MLQHREPVFKLKFDSSTKQACGEKKKKNGEGGGHTHSILHIHRTLLAPFPSSAFHVKRTIVAPFPLWNAVLIFFPPSPASSRVTNIIPANI